MTHLNSGSSTANQSKPSLFGSLNTSQPQQSGGLFGSSQNNTSQPQQSGGLFGSSQNNASQAQGSGIFGSTATAQPQQSGGLFGSTSTAAPQTQQSGGLFGSNAASQTQQSGGLFGSNAATQAQQTGGLFGSTLNNPPQQHQQAGGLFGMTGAGTQPQQQQQQQQQQGGGLFGSGFGNTGQQSTTSLFGGNNPVGQPQQGTSLFGSNAQMNQPQQTNSLFGNFGQTQNQTQNPNQQSSMFGNLNQQQNRPGLALNMGASTNAQGNQTPSLGLFGDNSSSAGQFPAGQQNTFGSSSRLPGALSLGQGGNLAQSQTVPGVKIDISNVRGTTRFNDLHEELQKQIEQMDAFIQQQIAFKEQCDALMPAHEPNLTSIPGDVEYVTSKLGNVESALDNDVSDVNRLKAIVHQDSEDAKISFRAVESLKLPQQLQYSGMYGSSNSMSARGRSGAAEGSSNEGGSSRDLSSYFGAQAAAFSKQLEDFQRHTTAIEDHLRSVEASAVAQSQQIMFRQGRDGSRRSVEDQTRELGVVLKQFGGGIVTVAEKVGQLRESSSELYHQSEKGALARW